MIFFLIQDKIVINLEQFRSLICIHFARQVQFIHCIKQYEGNGGDSLVTDGLHAANLLREVHPHKYQILTSTPVDWFDEGSDEVGEFLKVLQLPMIWSVSRYCE